MSRTTAGFLGAWLVLACGGAAWGGTGGYSAASVGYAWVDIAGDGTGILGGSGDAAYGAPIGFTFSFYGIGYTTAYVSTNGLVTFGGDDTTYGNKDLTYTGSVSRPSIAVLWDDWDANVTKAFYKTDGAAGSQRLIVQWEEFKHWDLPDGPGGTVTFQMILYEGSNNILFQYEDVYADNPAYDYGASATVGIAEGPASDDAYLQWSFNGVWYNEEWEPSPRLLSDGEAILFTAPPIPEPVTMVGGLASVVGLVGYVRRQMRRHRRQAV